MTPTLAVMAIWPMRLNHPVVQLQNGALRRANFADQYDMQVYVTSADGVADAHRQAEPWREGGGVRKNAERDLLTVRLLNRLSYANYFDGGVVPLLSTAEELPLRTTSLDLVTAFNCVHHFDLGRFLVGLEQCLGHDDAISPIGRTRTAPAEGADAPSEAAGPTVAAVRHPRTKSRRFGEPAVTFLARRGIFLVDLFVIPEMRGRGIARHTTCRRGTVRTIRASRCPSMRQSSPKRPIAPAPGAPADDNVFARTEGSAGQMLQLRPMFEGSYESPTVRLLGLYSFDMLRSNHGPVTGRSAGGCTR